MEYIVKRKGHNEPFDERKVYASVFAACMTLRITDEEAELIADMVSYEIKKAVQSHKEITAHMLHNHVAESLKKYHPDAAYLYKHHRDVS